MANREFPGIGKTVLTLAGASFVNGAILISASVYAGLQFPETQGAATTDGIVALLITLVLFVTPAMAALVVPLGLAAAYILNRQGWMKVWIAVPSGMLIGLVLSPIIGLLPDLILVSQLSSPLREIAASLGAGASGFVIWLGLRTNPYY